jgi:hypothetical protein
MAVVPVDEIPTVEAQPFAGRAIPRISDDVSPAAFGAGLGQGLESAANDVSQVAKYQAQQQKIAQDKANQDQDRVQIANANVALSAAHNEIVFGKNPDDPDAAYRQTGKALATLPEDYGAKFDTAAAQISSTLTPHQQAMFAERVASEKNSLDLNLRRYQYEQGDREAKEAFGNAKTQAIQNAALHYRDPAAIPKALEDTYNAGMALASRGGKDQVEAYKLSGYTHEADQVIESAIGGHLADGDIRGAQRDLNTYANSLSSGTVKDELENRIRAASDRIEAKQKDALHDKLEDTLAAARAGVPGAAGNFSFAEASVLRPGAGQHLINTINQTAEAGAQGKAYDQMPVSEVLNDIGQRHADLTGGPIEGAATRQSNFNMLLQEANRSINERKDPQAFLQKTQDRPAIDFTKPQDAIGILNTRFNTLTADSQHIEAPIAPLSNKEKAALSYQLNGMTSDDKLRALYFFRQGLGDERFRSLMEDVAPQSPVTAKAALMLPRDLKNTPSWYSPSFDNDSVAASTIMQGQDIINNPHAKEEGKGGFKGGLELPEDSKFRDSWNDDHRVSNGLFAGRPGQANATYEAAKSYYAAKVAMSGKTGQQVSQDTWKEAMDQVIGHTSDYNGGRTVGIPRGMDPSVFNDYVANAKAAVEKGWNLPKGSTEGTGLEQVGDSAKYFLIHDNKRMTDDAGNLIYLDLNQQYRKHVGP